MAQNPTFEGPWDPSTGAFPVVPTGTSSAYYFVTGPGNIGGFAFGEGDWLLYLEETGTPPNTGSWYRTAGGIIQLATTTSPASFTASDISDFSAAAHAAILVDNTTIVKDPSTGALHVLASGTGGGTTTVIEEEDDTYVPPHGHVSTELSDFVAAVRVSLGPTAAGRPFFSNTALTNAVVFTYDNTLHAVSADVKIDNATIVKNKYGQLVAGKPQPLAITDILGLTDYLNNYVSSFADPTLYPLHVASPTAGAWRPAGAHDFSGVKIGDAFYLLNVDITNLETSIANLNASFAGVIPVPPPALSSSIAPVLDPTVTFYEAYQAGTGLIVGVTLNTMPSTLPTASFFKGFTAAPSGTLTAFIDTVSAGQITPLDPAIDQTRANDHALVITEDQDSYFAEPAFHNLFKSIRAKIVPRASLSAGHHTYSLREILPGVGTSNSGIATVDIDIPTAILAMDIRSDAHLSPTPTPYYISGVPTLNPSIEYTLAPLTAEGVVGYTYGKNIVNIVGHNTLIDNEGDLPAASVPVAPDYIHGLYGNAITASYSFHLLDTYNEHVALDLAPYNSIGIKGPAYTLSLGRVDSTIENNRVFSGDPTLIYPPVFGAIWDPSQSLVGSTYLGELQKLNLNYRWPTGNYIGGPNYTNAAGVQVAGITGTWRWVTLHLATSIIGRVAFTLSFIDGNTSSWACNAYTRKTDGILIYAKLGTSGWVDCNNPYRGIGLADINGAFAMDARGHSGYETSASVKRVTLGPSAANSASGDLYVRVAIPYGSTKQFSDITVSDWA